MADQKPDGLVITDDAGNYYYLRPEILAQAKMPDAEVTRMKEGLAAQTGKGGELSVDDLQAVAGGVTTAHVGQVSISSSARTPVMSSTIMCPW